MWRSSNVTGVIFGSLNLFHCYQEHAEQGHKLWVSCICDLILPVTNQEAHDRTGWDARKAEEKTEFQVTQKPGASIPRCDTPDLLGLDHRTLLPAGNAPQ